MSRVWQNIGYTNSTAYISLNIPKNSSELDTVNSCCSHNSTTKAVKETGEAGTKFYRIPVKEPRCTLLLNPIATNHIQLYAASTLKEVSNNCK